MYHLTYLSDGLKVKGYLAFPRGYGIPASELRDAIVQYYGTSNLPITEIAAPLGEIRDMRPKKWPALIYCRGGIGHVGRVKTDWLERFAGHRHIVFAPSYRGSESGEGRDEFGGSDTEDVNAAVRLLGNLPFVDPARISLMGFSRGSVNAVRTAVLLPQVRKLVIWSGVTDLARTYEERVDLRKMLKRVIGGSPAKKPEAYEERSPIQMAEAIRCPVLVIHGTEDVQVDFGHGLRMYDKLKEIGADAAFHKYEGFGHHFPPETFEIAIGRMFDWLEN